MLEFWIALLIFVGSHVIIARPRIRQIFTKYLGESLYTFLYSVLSIIFLSWLIIAAQQSPRTNLWQWHHALYWIPNILMPLAVTLIVSGFTVPNPLSITARKEPFSPKKLSLTVAITRHPILWGFFLWAFAHIFPNGEYPLALLFTIFAIFSLLGLHLIDKKRQRELGLQKWKDMAQDTRCCPFISPTLWSGNFCITKEDIVGVFSGLIFYIFLYYFHADLFGMNPAPPL